MLYVVKIKHVINFDCRVYFGGNVHISCVVFRESMPYFVLGQRNVPLREQNLMAYLCRISVTLTSGFHYCRLAYARNTVREFISQLLHAALPLSGRISFLQLC